ncbi:MAG TPA: serine protease, partial [Anaerolineales bacterium]|nr:serine protease [Anaerolineales bacterium]
IIVNTSSSTVGAQAAWTPTPVRDPNDPEIVGGAASDPGEWPWQVALIGGSDPDLLGQFCGGSLITSQWVVTAAHCVYDFSTNPPTPINSADIDVVAGVYNVVTPVAGFQRRNVSQIIRHASFNPTSPNLEFDIALLQLGSPITIGYTGQIKTSLVPLVSSSVGTLAGTNAWVTGWGAIASGGPLADRILEVQIPVITNTNCNNAYNPFGFTIASSMLCAGSAGKDACQGDSGGPLVVPSGNKWTLAGIVSWGIDCGVNPGVYTRVSDFVSWINTSVPDRQNVFIGDQLKGKYGLIQNQSIRDGYVVDDGPAQVVSTNGASVITALRVIWKEPGPRYSYSEMMGLPVEQLSNEYWFPWYNFAAPNSMDQGFRIANVDSGANTVEVRVGTTLLDTIALGGGDSVRVGYPAVDNGPIKILCTTCSNTGTDKIIAALRVIWKEPGFRASYSEMMGLPREQLSSEYWFPWYNNAAVNSMDQGFRIANVDAGPNTVEVRVGTTLLDTIALGGGASVRVGYTIDNGPIQIRCTTCSTGTDKIIAALRVIWKEPGFRASYSEMMGLPAEALSTEYWFPWYNNLDTASMDQGFRIANVDTVGHTVRVFVGAAQVGTDLSLAAGGSVRVGFSVNNGPIRIVCTTCNAGNANDRIIAALRVIWQEPGFRASYSEMMGLPAEQLSTEYWFPWYNNASAASMDQGFRIGVP